MSTDDLTDREVLELSLAEVVSEGPEPANEQSGIPDYRRDEQHHGRPLPELDTASRS